MPKAKDEIAPPPPGPDEAPLPTPAALEAGSGDSLAAVSPEAPAQPDIDLELAVLRELDAATQEAYVVYCDKLIESGDLQAPAFSGLNEAVKSAWRAVVKFVRDQEGLDDASR